jgi:S-adenosylmethionine synthetase
MRTSRRQSGACWLLSAGSTLRPSKHNSLVEGVEEVYVWHCSQIGQPIDRPWVTSAQVRLVYGARLADVEPAIQDIVYSELADLPSFIDRLVRGGSPAS